MAHDEKRGRGETGREPNRDWNPARRLPARLAPKFVWQDGDVEILPVPKKAPGQNPPRPHEDDGRPEPGRG